MAEFSSLVTEYKLSVSLFFWLNFSEPILLETLKTAGFTETLRPPQTIELAPGLKARLGPPTIQLANFKSVTFEYNSEKFMLGLKGTLNDVKEAFGALPEAFEKQGYSIVSVIRYYEIMFSPQPFDLKNIISSLNANIKFSKPLKLNNEDLKVFSLSLSNSNTPIGEDNFNKWFHIKIEPDIQNTNNRFFISFIRREKDFRNCLTFLERIEEILNSIKKWLGGF